MRTLLTYKVAPNQPPPRRSTRSRKPSQRDQDNAAQRAHNEASLHAKSVSNQALNKAAKVAKTAITKGAPKSASKSARNTARQPAKIGGASATRQVRIDEQEEEPQQDQGPEQEPEQEQEPEPDQEPDVPLSPPTQQEKEPQYIRSSSPPMPDVIVNVLVQIKYPRWSGAMVKRNLTSRFRNNFDLFEIEQELHEVIIERTKDKLFKVTSRSLCLRSPSARVENHYMGIGELTVEESERVFKQIDIMNNRTTKYMSIEAIFTYTIDFAKPVTVPTAPVTAPTAPAAIIVPTVPAPITKPPNPFLIDYRGIPHTPTPPPIQGRSPAVAQANSRLDIERRAGMWEQHLRQRLRCKEPGCANFADGGMCYKARGGYSDGPKHHKVNTAHIAAWANALQQGQCELQGKPPPALLQDILLQPVKKASRRSDDGEGSFMARMGKFQEQMLQNAMLQQNMAMMDNLTRQTHQHNPQPQPHFAPPPATYSLPPTAAIQPPAPIRNSSPIDPAADDQDIIEQVIKLKIHRTNREASKAQYRRFLEYLLTNAWTIQDLADVRDGKAESLRKDAEQNGIPNSYLRGARGWVSEYKPTYRQLYMAD